MRMRQGRYLIQDAVLALNEHNFIYASHLKDIICEKMVIKHV